VSAPSQPPARSQPVHWWGTRVGRFAILLIALTVLLLAPIHLHQTSALVVGIAGLSALALLALTRVRQLVFRVRTRAVDDLQVLGRSLPASAVTRDVRTVGTLMRALGIAVPALVFFTAWALLYAVIWAAEPSACAVATSRCNGAFVGLGTHPILGDFVYYAVNIGFANPPPDIVAESRAARAAATVEIVAAAGFLAAYLGAFLTGRGMTSTGPPPSDPATTSTPPPADPA
jgi:uncharacterized membrane protein